MDRFPHLVVPTHLRWSTTSVSMCLEEATDHNTLTMSTFWTLVITSRHISLFLSSSLVLKARKRFLLTYRYRLDKIDTLTWTNPQTTGVRPRRRRAHTTCVYNNCIYVFGGGDGVQALNDTYQLNLADMHWTEMKTTGAIPISRGYHSSNLIKNHFIVYGGSDGHECFSDVHVLDLGKKIHPAVILLLYLAD